jgi:hypothetical protein
MIRLKIYGSGFSLDKFTGGNVVYVGPFPCPVVDHLSSGSVVGSNCLWSLTSTDCFLGLSCSTIAPSCSMHLSLLTPATAKTQLLNLKGLQHQKMLL